MTKLEGYSRYGVFVLMLSGMWSMQGGAQSAGSAPTSAQGNSATGSAAPAPVPAFEVATIKPGSNDGPQMMMFTPDGLSIKGIPMQMIIREAFQTEDDRIVNAPSWVKSTRYNIEAKVGAEDVPRLKDLKRGERQEMLLPLLVDRFNLKYHHETRELTSYSLVVAKGGVKMKEHPPEPAPAKAAPKDGEPDAPKGPPKGSFMRMLGPGHIESEGTPLMFLAHILSQQLGKSVVDRTGLTGSYDYTLQWTPDDAAMPMKSEAGGPPPHDDNAAPSGGPSLYTAIEEQLGLKIESTKGPVDVIVIDHLDLPSAN